MEPSGRIKHAGPPQSTAGRGLRPDTPVFTPQGHCDEPKFGPPQQMYQNPNQPPTSSVFSYSRAVKKQPENVNYQRNNFQNIRNELVQPVKPADITPINNPPQPDQENSTTSWRVAGNLQQSERQDSQRNSYQQRSFQNNQIESVQPFEPENIRNLPQPNQRNSTTPWAVDNNVQPNERQNRQDFSSSDYKGNSAKGNFNKNSQKSARVDESCNLYQEIDGRPQNHSAYQARGQGNRYNTGGQGHRYYHHRDNYQKENDQRRTSTNNFNKNTADDNSNNSAAEANTVSDSWGDREVKPIDSNTKSKTKDDNSKQSTGEPQETRSGYGHNNRGYKPRDNNYDSRRTSFNKNTADHDDSHNSAAEANTVSDSWDDWDKKPTESSKKFKTKDETSKCSKDFKRDPQEIRSGYGHNNRGYKPRDNNYDSRRTSFNKNTADHDDSNNSAAEANAVSDSWDDWDEKPTESSKKFKTKDETSKCSKDFKRDPQETRSGYGHNNRGYKPRDNNYDSRRTSFNKNTADHDDSNNSAAEANAVSDSWDDWEEKPTESSKKFKTKVETSKWSKDFKRDPQETRSGYGHNNRGYKPRDNNYDSRRTSFNKNTADHDDSNNSAAEANTVSDSWDDWDEKPTESSKKFKTKDETSKCSKDFKRDPQETRSGYGHNNRGYKPRDNNYDSRRTSFNKNTADHDGSNNSAAEANAVSDSWDDWDEKPTESSKKFKTKDETSKCSKDFKRDPQETRSGYGHNNRGYKPRDNNYDSRRTSFNKNTADHDDSNNSAAEANTVSDSWGDWEEKPTESTKKFKTEDETSKWSKDFKRDPQETRSGYGNRHNNRDYKPRDNNYDPRRTSINNSSKYSADNNRDNSNNSVEHQITPESWEDNEDIPPKNVPVINSQDDDDVKEHTKPKEEPKTKDTKNTDSRQRHERSPKNVHQDKRTTDSKEEIDENDLAWNAEFSSTPEKPEQTSKQWEYQRYKPKDPRMDREKLNKSESSIFRDQSYIDKTVRRSDGNYRQSSSGVSDKDKEIWDKEFNKWDREWKRIKNFKIVIEIEGDLFEQPKEYSLAHWGDWEEKPIDSTKKVKTKDDNSKWSKDFDREPQETRSGYGNRHNNRGHNYDSRRTSFNKNTADHDDSNNSAAEANTVSDSWGDWEEKPTESTKKFKTEDETSKWSKDFKRDPQETRNGYGNCHNNRDYKPRDNNYDPRRTSINNSSKYSADNNRVNANNSVEDNDVQNNDKPPKNVPVFDSQDDDVKECTKRRKDFKREPQETRSGYGNRHNNRDYKSRDNNYDPRRTSINNSSKYSADNNRDNSNNSVEHQIIPESWEDNEDIPPKNVPVIDSQDDDDDVKEHTKPKEEPKAKDTKNTCWRIVWRRI